jgi:benzoate membrane transport protein
VLAAFGASLVKLFAAMPPALITTVAGVALIGPLAGALGAALAAERQRFAAVLALVVTASGVSVLGVGSPFWGLLAGLLALALDKAGRRLGAATPAPLPEAAVSARPDGQREGEPRETGQRVGVA